MIVGHIPRSVFQAEPRLYTDQRKLCGEATIGCRPEEGLWEAFASKEKTFEESVFGGRTDSGMPRWGHMLSFCGRAGGWVFAAFMYQMRFVNRIFIPMSALLFIWVCDGNLLPIGV